MLVSINGLSLKLAFAEISRKNDAILSPYHDQSENAIRGLEDGRNGISFSLHTPFNMYRQCTHLKFDD